MGDKLPLLVRGPYEERRSECMFGGRILALTDWQVHAFHAKRWAPMWAVFSGGRKP